MVQPDLISVLLSEEPPRIPVQQPLRLHAFAVYTLFDADFAEITYDSRCLFSVPLVPSVG